MKLESDNIQNYLRSTSLIDWDHPTILEKASELTKGLKDDVDKAKCLYEWVRDEIPHSKDINAKIVTSKDSEVLSEKTGICYAKTILLAAMLRAEGIPAGFCYQILRKDSVDEGTLVHALNSIFLQSIGKWIRVDSRGNTGSFNGQFGIENEKLVFPDNSEKSVIIYEKIFTDPSPVVVDTLMKYDDCNEMIQNLPEDIELQNS